MLWKKVSKIFLLSLLAGLPLALASPGISDCGAGAPRNAISRLIIGGKLVPAPYTVAVSGDHIEVNGIPLSSGEAESEPIEDFDDPALTHFVDRFFEGLATILANEGSRYSTEAIQQNCWEYMQSHPLVETVRFSGETELAFRFHGDTIEYRTDLRPGRTIHEPDAIDEQLALQEFSQTFRRWLSTDALIVVQDEAIFVVPEMEAEHLLEQLAVICMGEEDYAQRYDRIRRLVPHTGMAEAMAHHLRDSLWYERR